jgi:peptide/nickel transport system permease protein
MAGRWTLYLGRRLGEILIVLFGVATITFIITHLLGTPVALLVGNTATKEAIVQARHSLGLDQPLYVQYWHFLGHLVHGDLGASTHTFNPVSTDIGQRLPITFELVATAMVIAVVVGVLLGVTSAVWRGRAPDAVGQTVAQGAMSIPSFWLGLILVFFFYAKLHLLPAPLGQLDDAIEPPQRVTGVMVVDSVLAGNWVALRSALEHLILPALTLSLVAIPSILQITRNSAIEVLKSDYIRTARAYGIRQRSIVLKYALRNVVAPVTTVIAMSFGFLMSGTVLIEAVFAWPGLGLYAVDSLSSQDYQPIVALVLLSALFYAGSYLIADIVASMADPRIQLGS